LVSSQETVRFFFLWLAGRLVMARLGLKQTSAGMNGVTPDDLFIERLYTVPIGSEVLL